MRAVSVKELDTIRRDVIEMDGKWKEGFGPAIEKGSRIFIYGKSRNGKSSFVAQLAKFLASQDRLRVGYNSLEEGLSLTLKLNFQRVNMADVNKKLLILNKMGYEDLLVYLRKRQSPGVIVIDSVQYFRITFEQWQDMEKEFPKVIWIIVSQVKGSLPKGPLAEALYFHADVKVNVEGFVAFATGRFGGGKPIVIWGEGAAKYGHDSEHDIKF